jgi:hypothetical protein
VSDRRRDPMRQFIVRAVSMLALAALVIDGGLKW